MARAVGLSQRRTRLIGRLRLSKSRGREGLVLVEGVRAVDEALGAGADVRFAVTSPSVESSEAGAALVARMRRQGLDLTEVADGELEGLADTRHPQGALLVCAQPRVPLDGVVQGRGRYLVLDGVQDPGNAGTLVRAALAFSAHAVIVLDGTVDPWGAKAVRASAGMVFRVPVTQVPASEAIAAIGAAGVPLWVADPQGVDVREKSAAEGFALVVGNEGAGPREAVRAAAESDVAVKMRGRAESLNVGVAGSILLYELTRELHT